MAENKPSLRITNEIYEQYEYTRKFKPSLYYYRTRGGVEIDLILKTKEKLIGIECVTTIDNISLSTKRDEKFLQKISRCYRIFYCSYPKVLSIG
ncbi:DUF4143 domain-containing protein [Coxiella-like endosymbiont]|uniref:DUF4143 domain-containing protein n=1 Tax=Coxiella-like endosymbiont TaxID=1592897 RepID=UPI0034E2E519